MLGPFRGQPAEDAGCFPRRSRTPIEGFRRTPLGRLRSRQQDPLQRVQSPKTSRCHPGCISPELQESVEAHFCRLPAKTQQAVHSPRHRACAERNRNGASAPPELGETPSAEDPPSARKAAQIYCEQLLSPPQTPSAEDPPSARKAAQIYCEQLLSPPQEEASETQKDVFDVQRAFIRLPKELKEGLKVLGRPHAVWPAELCKELRIQAVKRCGPEEAALLQKLQLCVKLATDFALKRGFYEVQNLQQKMFMADVLAPSLQVQWFGHSNSRIPETKVDIGKAVPPPLIISDASCLDIAEELRRLTAKREIFVVTELLDFDAEGAARFGVASQRPHCMTLRGDLQRFVQYAAKHMKRKKLSLQKVLCDWKMPQVFLAKDVSCFRGSQGDGYPFLPRPFQFHVVGMALWTARPRLRTERDHLGERMTMYCDSDDAKAYEVRLELCAHAALLAAGGPELPTEEKPVLVLPVIGLGGSSFHPQDAVVLALKSFRRRFTQFFHSIYVCCGDRGPNFSLSDFIESAVNRSVYMMAQNDSLAAKAMPWHWDQREIQMSIAASRLEKIGHHMRQGPTYVVKIKNDRRSAERKQIVEKTEVHYGFGTLRAYHHRKQLEAADELIKAQRRDGNWPADMVHIKLGGLRDNLELSPEFEDLSEMDERSRKSWQVKQSMSKIEQEFTTSQPTSPLSKDLGALQDLMLSVRSSSKTRTFRGWLTKADAVTQQMGGGGQSGRVLLHAKRQSRKESVSVEAAVASQDVRLDTCESLPLSMMR